MAVSKRALLQCCLIACQVYCFMTFECQLNHICLGSQCRSYYEDSRLINICPELEQSDCKCVANPTPGILKFYAWHPSQLYYHLHISKTGGTTFRMLMEEQFQQDYPQVQCCDNDAHKSRGTSLVIDPEVFSNGSCQAISYEGEYSTIPQQFPRQRPHLILFLRHPIVRTVSQFLHDDDKHHTRFTFDQSNILQVYEYSNQQGIEPHPRYQNWYQQRLYDPVRKSIASLRQDFAFIGITEYFKTSMCLFYFTFQMHQHINSCLNEDFMVRNVACQGLGVDQQTEDCSKRTKFNFHQDDIEESPKQRLLKQLDEIPDEHKEAIRKHASIDMNIYDDALHLFWTRVAIMEKMTNLTFSDLPNEYRETK